MPSAMTTNDQAAQRRYERKRDQHGRLWGTNIELKNGHPTGKIEFIAHVKDPQWNPKPEFIEPPLLPPQQYLRIVEGDPYRIHIDYDAWLTDARRATAEYKRAVMLEAMRIHGSAYDPEKPTSPEVLAIVGAAPIAPELVIASRQENPWIIGRVKKPDVRLAPFLVRTQRFQEPDYSEMDFGPAKAAS